MVINFIKKWAWFNQQRSDYKSIAEFGIQQIKNDFYKDQPREIIMLPSNLSAINYLSSDNDDDHLDNEIFNNFDSYTEYCQANKVLD